MDEVNLEVDTVIGIEALCPPIAAACNHMQDKEDPRKRWTLVVARISVYLNIMKHIRLILVMCQSPRDLLTSSDMVAAGEEGMSPKPEDWDCRGWQSGWNIQGQQPLNQMRD